MKRSLQVGIVLYHNVTALDFVGPHTVLGKHGNVHLYSTTIGAVQSDIEGLSIMATKTFEDIPDMLDVILVPGGDGSYEAMQDCNLLSFLRNVAPLSKFITSVCSGSTILGAAGLLDGYAATTHWAYYEVLSAFDTITCVQERVVQDRNRITAGGVTAGIDFGLILLARLCDSDTAKCRQLMLEYDPSPPFNAGTREGAGQLLSKKVSRQVADNVKACVQAAKAITNAKEVERRS